MKQVWKLLFIFALFNWKKVAAQSTTISYEGTTSSGNATTPPSQVTCSGNWTEWSICFPGTISNPAGYQDRMYKLTPSQFEATDCQTEFTVNAIEVRPCDDYELPFIEDLPNAEFDDMEYFRCGNNRLILKYLACNGDDDCGDNSDEYPSQLINCSEPFSEKRLVCGLSQERGSSSVAPIGERFLTGISGIEEFAAGFDILTGTFKGNVLSMAGHGSCRRVLISGSTDTYYRLPQNVAALRQLHDVIVDPGKVFEGGSALLNETENSLKLNLNLGTQGTDDLSGKTGFTQSELIKELVVQSLVDDQSKTFSSVRTHVNTAKVTLKDAGSLEVSTEFISKVMELPYSEFNESRFSYSKYMQLLEDFGTHFVSSGKLGGSYSDTEIYSRCWLESSSYEDYSSIDWKENIRECTRLSFFSRLNANGTDLSTNCKITDKATSTVKTLREEAVDYYISVAGGSIETASDLKFTFSKTAWEEWIKSIVTSPQLNLNELKLEKISSLVWAKSIPMNTTRKEQVARYIDYAIQLYLEPYDAQHWCVPCPVNNTVERLEYTDDGDEVDVMNYGKPYLTGTGEDYKCHCIYEMPTKEATCGAMRSIATIFTLFLSVVVTYWNVFGR